MTVSEEKKAEEAKASTIAPKAQERSCSLAPVAEKPLTALEKKFLLLVERGDCASVRRIIQENLGQPENFDINCKDPLDRSGLISAIENENNEMIEILLEAGIQVKDSLLHAIKEEYVEGVELLLEHEESIHKAGEPYSWEAVDRAQSAFTPDITPLILAAHMNNYEIIKILLDRGATLPMPHDVTCGCEDCLSSSDHDSLRHSQARINAYRALSSPSLIALSSRDPILTAFELSWDLRRLTRMENEFSDEYKEMRKEIQTFVSSLLDHARTSAELDTVLNHDPDGEGFEVVGQRSRLERLKLAIDYKQKNFVAHPSVQQLLSTMWYDGLPGFRRLGLIGQLINVVKIAASFPTNSIICKLAPKSETAKMMEKPFIKFINHSFSYLMFLTLLGAASLRVEYIAMELFGNEWMQEILREWQRKDRGSLPGFFEAGIIMYVFGYIFSELTTLWSDGPLVYISDLWNIVDFVSNTFYITWIGLRGTSIFISWREYWNGWDPYYPREDWDPFDPMLLSEGMFAAAMIFSFLKLVHIFSVNPHLGPLQISLGRMIIDIIKFFFIYSLVLFAFGCGMNKLLWYYADLEMHNCYHLPSGLPDFADNDFSCTIWRRFSNLFETSQSLFWAGFGLVDLMAFELTGIKSFTRFWALLMFGSYSVINIIVLLNMLIAMMSNSYQIISEHSDTEWKFARSKLWMGYFEEGDSVPAPFNLIPSINLISIILGTVNKPRASIMVRNREIAIERHDVVTRLLVRRFVTAEQRKRDDFGITEDDIMEVRQDISTLRYELVDILKNNGMKTPDLDKSDLAGKKKRVMERRLKQDFKIDYIEGVVNTALSEKGTKDVFGKIAKALNKRKSTIKGGPKTELKKKDWNEIAKRKDSIRDPIGSTKIRETRRNSQNSTRRNVLSDPEVNMEKLIEEHPKLKDMTPTAQVAYVKFRTRKIKRDMEPKDKIDEEEGKIVKEANKTASNSAMSHFASSVKATHLNKAGSIKAVGSMVLSKVIDETAGTSHETSAPTKHVPKTNIDAGKSMPSKDKQQTEKKSEPELGKLPPPPEVKSRRRSSPRPSIAAVIPDAEIKPEAPKKPLPCPVEKKQYSSDLEPGKGKSKISGKMIEGWI